VQSSAASIQLPSSTISEASQDEWTERPDMPLLASSCGGWFWQLSDTTSEEFAGR
jgi:hypothetical protein